MRQILVAIAVGCLVVPGGAAYAKSCGNDAGGFQAWLSDFEGRAKAA
jgi:hypothetical protein